MLDIIVEFIKNSKEFQGWGLNWLTAGALGTVICTIIQGIGVKKQNKVIKQKQSAESLSELTIAYYLFCFIAFLIYGARLNSLVMMFNGCLFLLYIAFLKNVYKFKVIPKWKLITTRYMVILPFIMIIIWQEHLRIYMLSLLTVVLVVLVLQILELCKTRKPGVINVFYFSTFVIGNICWIIFSRNTEDWVMQTFAFISLVFQITIISLTLYFKFKMKNS